MVGQKGTFKSFERKIYIVKTVYESNMPDAITKKGKVSASLILNLIGALISVLGVALVSITVNPIVEIVGGVIVAAGVALIAISKHIG